MNDEDSIPFAIFQTGTTCSATPLVAGGTCTIVVQMSGVVAPASTPLDTPPVTLLVTEALTTVRSSASQALVGQTILPASLILVGMADQLPLTTSAQFGSSVNTIDLGSIKSGSETGKVTLWFKNEGDVAAETLSFLWFYLDTNGALVTKSGYAGLPAADQPFLIPSAETDQCNLGGNLAAGTSCKVTVYAKPTSDLLTLGTKSVRFKLTAVGPLTATSPKIQTEVQAANTNFFTVVTPAQNAFLSFTQVGTKKTPVGGTSDEVTFQFNAGPSGAAVTGLADTAEFKLVAGHNTCAAALPAGGTCTFGVVFTPPVTDPYATNNVYRFGTMSIGTTVLGLGAQVQSPAALTLLPAGNVDFGEIQTTLTVTKTFTVSNSGETDTTAAITAPTPFSANSANYSLGSLAACATVTAGGTCTFTVSAKPIAVGVLNTNLTVVNPAFVGGQAVSPLKMTGVLTGNTITLSTGSSSDISTYAFGLSPAW